MKFIINGALGRMGKQLQSVLGREECPHEIAALVDFNGDGETVLKSLSDYCGEADCIIDFSHHTAINDIYDYATEKGIPCLIATTGQTEDELAKIELLSKKVGVFRSANMSLGIALLADCAKKVAAMMPDADIEIIEKHHNQKLDAPSGTALLLADQIKTVRSDAVYQCSRSGMKKREKNDIGIHAVRIGGEVGTHEILISTGKETLTLSHQAHTRDLFAEGAVAAAAFLATKGAGMYSMQDMIIG